MAILGREIRITRLGDPPFLMDTSIMVDGQPPTRCWQQVWCLQQVLGPTTPVDEVGGDEACSTSCLRQLRLPPGFTPLVDRRFN